MGRYLVTVNTLLKQNNKNETRGSGRGSRERGERHTGERALHVPLSTVLRESIKIPGLCRRMSVAVVGLVCSDQLS